MLKTESDPIPYRILRYLIEYAPQAAATMQEIETAMGRDDVDCYIYAMQSEDTCWVYLHRGEYRPTVQGLEVYAEASKDPRLAHADYHRWITEARSGMNYRGNQTDITRAAIPIGKHYRRKPDDVKRYEAMAIHLAGSKLGIDPNDVIDQIQKGTMKLCPSCGNYKQSVAFHKDGQKKDGRTSLCKVCRKEKAAIPQA